MTTLLPPSATPLEYAVTTVNAERLDALPTPHRLLWSPDQCPAQLLPWLAWALSVDVWRDNWPENVKRAAIRNAADIHRRKGTAGAVKRAVNALGSDIVITEWWEANPQAAPYTFELEFTPSHTLPNDIDFQQDVINSVDASKNLRSSYTLRVKIPGITPLAVGSVLRVAQLTQIGTQTTADTAPAYPPELQLINPSAESEPDQWLTIRGGIARHSSDIDLFSPWVFTGATHGYNSAAQDWPIPARYWPQMQAGLQLEYSYWTSDPARAQVGIEAFDDAGLSLGVYIPDVENTGICQVSSTVSLPASTRVLRLVQQFESNDPALFIDLITAQLQPLQE